MKNLNIIIFIMIFNFCHFNLHGSYPDLDLDQKLFNTFFDKCCQGGYHHAVIDVEKQHDDSYSVTFYAMDPKRQRITAENNAKLSRQDSSRSCLKSLLTSYVATCDSKTHNIVDFIKVILGEKAGTVTFQKNSFTIQ